MSVPGKLIIRPKQAKITRNTQWFGKMDPFIKLEFEKQNAQSEVCTAGGNKPFWNNTILFNRLSASLLYIALLDHESYKQHDLIGTTEIDISDVFIKTESTTRWVDVYYEGKTSATIQIQFFFQALEMTQSSMKSSGTGGSLMMSKKSKMGQKQNIYQQPQLYKEPSNGQNAERFLQQKPPSYNNECIQFCAGYQNRDNFIGHDPKPYVCSEYNNKVGYKLQNLYNNKEGTEGYMSYKTNVLNSNPYEMKQSTQAKQKPNKSKVAPDTKFTADQMDRFLDD